MIRSGVKLYRYDEAPTRASSFTRDVRLDRGDRLDRGASVHRAVCLTRANFNLANLYPYQVAGVQWLSARRRAILADVPGLGKTAQLLRANTTEPMIVICPAMLEGVWRSQAAKWRPDLTVRTGSGKMVGYGQLDIYSYDYRGTLPNVSGVTIVPDELHYLRHPEIARSNRWSYIAKSPPSVTRIWGATGTPIVGYKDELTAVLEAIGLTHPEILRRTEADVDLDLPSRVYDEIPASIGNDLYHVLSILDERWAELDRTKLPPLSMMTTARVQLARSKVEAAHHWIARHEDERLIIYSTYVDPLRALVSGRRDWALVTGEQTIEERDAIISAFESGKFRGLACTIGAVGVGVTIVSTHRMLFLDRDWTPGVNEQTEKRVCRIGQKAKRVFITDLVADHPLEKRVYEILARKRADAERVYELCST